MGLSVSVAVAVLFVGFIVAFSLLYSSVRETLDDVMDASDEKYEYILNKIHTKISIMNVSYDNINRTLHILVLNDGSITLNSKKVDVVLNGSYESDRISNLTVNGNHTQIWAPKTVLKIEMWDVPLPTRIKVITENGISAYFEF